MKKTILYFVFLISLFQSIFAQEINYIAIFSDSLKENTNAIIKENTVEIEIPTFNKINIKKRRVITVFNETGLQHLDASEYFDNSTTIKSIEAKIYNSVGSEIKKIKRKDFKENSLNQGSVITDNRILYLDYTPIQYPFTMVYESETSGSNTAFIPSWSPIDDYFVSTVSSKFIITFGEDVKLKYKEYNFDERIKKNEDKNRIEYAVNNIIAVKGEQLTPSFSKFIPYVMFGLEEFEIEGIKGNAKDWDSFGKWMYSNLLSDTEEIPEVTKNKIQELIGQEKDTIAIAKIIYKYVQDKTRYVSIQLGIGGWRPMLAKDVDRLGYGDCKALSNYTRSLLKTFNIPSYYTIVYGDNNKRSLQKDFVSMQGNHIILGVPKQDEIIWLECTSQSQPFGFQGDFTDDRNVLIIGEDKSEIVTTKAFNNNANLQTTKAIISFSDDGTIHCEATINSIGIEFDEKMFLESETPDNKTKYYKSRFSQLNNLKIIKNELNIDKDKIDLNEILQLSASDFLKKSGDRIVVPINVLNQISYIPQKYKQRKNPFEIERGYQYLDELEITIPEGYKIEAMSEGFELDSKFGKYKSTLEQKESKLIFHRSFLLQKGYYPNTEYNDYRNFREQIAKFENIKIVLKEI